MRFKVLPRHLTTVYFVVALLLLGSHSNANPRLSDTESSTNEQTQLREKNLVIFNEVWQTIFDRYYDPNLNGANWQTIGLKFRSMAADARNSAELYNVLRRMVSQLRDAHTRIYSPNERFDWQRPRLVTTGISLREIGGAPVVVTVEPGSMAERAGIRSGDKIVSIDGIPALTLYSKLLEEATSASTFVAARSQAIGSLLEGPQGTFVKVGFVSTDGRERTATLLREVREKRAELRIRRLKDGIMVVEFNTFTDQIASEFTTALKEKLHNARGIIFDLRNNGGGEVDVMSDITSTILPVGKDLGRFINRQGKIALAMKTRTVARSSDDSDETLQLSAPIVILTSERTASSAEIFAAVLKDEKRATIVGQTTCGCVLGLRRSHTLPDGGELNISELDYKTSRNQRLEGIGVTPDEIVIPNLNDLRAHRDISLERAIKILSNF
jgi:carboxyl-terminal processing protease